MARIEDERTFSDMDVKSDPAGADLLQIADSEDGGRVKKIPISALLAEDGTDTNAIHVDVANEILAITAKVAPTILDLGVIEDVAAAGVKKRILLGAIMKMVGWVAALTAKATPVGADLIAVEDSEAAGAMKKSTIQQIFAAVGLIDGLTAKAVPLAADTLVINDSAAAGAAKKSTLQQLFAALGLIDGLTSKVTPVGADTFAINDSAAGGAAKKVAVSTLVLVSNNLSDVTAATARANIGANTKNVPMGRLDMIAANADVLRYVHRGASLTIESIDSVLSAAIDVDATITAAIDGVAVTNGVVSVTAAGSAAGTKDQAVPTAANVLAAGSELTLTIGGGDTSASFAHVAIYGTY